MNQEQMRVAVCGCVLQTRLLRNADILEAMIGYSLVYPIPTRICPGAFVR